MMDGLEPPADVMQSESPTVEGLLAALQVLVRVFTKHPVGVCNQRLIQLVHNWMPWILGKVCVLICYHLTQWGILLGVGPLRFYFPLSVLIQN